MSDYFLGDPPDDRGPIVGIPKDDLDALHARIRELEAENAALREKAQEDGRPCSADKFLNEAIDIGLSDDELHEAFEAWVCGDWQEATLNLPALRALAGEGE